MIIYIFLCYAFSQRSVMVYIFNNSYINNIIALFWSRIKHFLINNRTNHLYYAISNVLSDLSPVCHTSRTGFFSLSHAKLMGQTKTNVVYKINYQVVRVTEV